MNKQTIHDFWNFPGVLGIAIIKVQSQLHFYVKEELLNAQKKQAVIQDILQRVEKADQRLESFEFQVMDYNAYTHKVSPELTFVVLAYANSVVIKMLAANQLQPALQEDINGVITVFELLTKKIAHEPGVVTVKNPAAISINSHPAVLTVTVEDLVKAINALSKFSSNYMGVKLTVSYMQSTRPNFEWLNNFQINSTGKIIYSGAIAEPISPIQHEWVKKWTAAFIKSCSQIVQDLPTMIEQKGLDESTKKLLLTSLTS